MPKLNDVYLRGVRLTPREWEIASLLAVGFHGKAIAARLGTASYTVKTQLSSIYRKMTERYPEELVDKDARIILVKWVLEYLAALDEPCPPAEPVIDMSWRDTLPNLD